MFVSKLPWSSTLFSCYTSACCECEHICVVSFAGLAALLAISIAAISVTG